MLVRPSGALLTALALTLSSAGCQMIVDFEPVTEGDGGAGGGGAGGVPDGLGGSGGDGARLQPEAPSDPSNAD
jgi:hypothetical protein